MVFWLLIGFVPRNGRRGSGSIWRADNDWPVPDEAARLEALRGSVEALTASAEAGA